FYRNHRVAVPFGGVAHSLRPPGDHLLNPILYLVLLLNRSLLRNSKYNLLNLLPLLHQSSLRFKLCVKLLYKVSLIYKALFLLLSILLMLLLSSFTSLRHFINSLLIFLCQLPPYLILCFTNYISFLSILFLLVELLGLPYLIR
ncbi:hypothetical protein V2W45_1483856, partial [Cenococcum geophilum]